MAEWTGEHGEIHKVSFREKDFNEAIALQLLEHPLVLAVVESVFERFDSDFSLLQLFFLGIELRRKFCDFHLGQLAQVLMEAFQA